ncbi:DNA methyltransferase [Phenylobacterium sp.]|uniref:site-specific DNA-methyltransferase n=1 Tax=Phenylobacterium sp. TaxID=1871053 RepID=UPI00272FF91A|nr:DNA methyltransferase [Phenylobacterium sp.]MDP1618120.1 DNA methyltransferase [Phenylobacterium sp.]MDP1986527.1 DNA methyltransferase [Phenylobacterium sp.]
MNATDPAQNYSVEFRSPAALRPYARNARRHSKAQVKQIAASIQRFGFTNPVLIGDDDEIIAGHGRVEAAKALGLASVPTVRLSHLTADERRAYLLADNKLALNAGWDTELLAIELQALIDLDFDVALAGFSVAEIDFTLDAARDGAPERTRPPEDEIVVAAGAPVTLPGDVWILGRHRLVCGDARDPSAYAAVMPGERAGMLFTDPPYNVPIDGHVTGLGKQRHREFAMASGEMSKAAFTTFLIETLACSAGVCRNGAIAFVCMGWRHMGELLDAGQAVFSELKNLCVWNKTNGGMGTFYRSKHELIFVFKVGDAPHINNFGLGDGGRYRTNVWDYPGVSSMGASRKAALEMHPTVKPTALVADAIRDCSARGDIVLDAFAGSGTTLIAAETCGRLARLIEFDPIYCDTIVRRFENYTGKSARLLGADQSFEDIRTIRASKSGDTPLAQSAFQTPARQQPQPVFAVAQITSPSGVET